MHLTIHLPAILRPWPLSSAIAFLSIASASLWPSTSSARILVVDRVEGPYLTIQSAADVAARGDTIEVAPGVYTESISLFTEVTMISQAGASATVLDGRERGPIFVDIAQPTEIVGFTLRRAYGGAIKFTGIEVSAEECLFSDNRAAAGGAVRVSSGRFRAKQCEFRNNDATEGAGGAVCLLGSGAEARFDSCLFVDNAQFNDNCKGAAIAYVTRILADTDEASPATEAHGRTGGIFVDACTFLRNSDARAGNAIYCNAGVPIRISRSIFQNDGPTSFIGGTLTPSSVSCSIFWPLPSPNVTGAVPTSPPIDSVLVVDPRLCVGGTPALHASSPALEFCGGVGNLPIGCDRIELFRVEPRQIRSGGERLFRLFAYGLSPQSEVTLRGADGSEARGTLIDEDGIEMTYRFDLTKWPAGEASLEATGPNGTDLLERSVRVDLARAYCILPSRAGHAGVYAGAIGGSRLDNVVAAGLRHRETGVLYPLSLGAAADAESLQVTGDFSTAPNGVYDLVIEAGSGFEETLVSAFYLGTPPVVRVPADAPTITAAIAMALPGAEILVDAGAYRESIVIDRPVRLVGSPWAARPVLEPGESGGRVVRVLETAGPLTEIVNFVILNGSVVDGPGAGVWAQTAALLRSDRFEGNQASGVGSIGGAVAGVEGLRVVDNLFYANGAHSPDRSGENLFHPGSGAGGMAGALACRECLVARNTFEHNSAVLAGAAVVTGVIRENRFSAQTSAGERYSIGALSGEIEGNVFDQDCLGGNPMVWIDGPSRVTRNVFRSVDGQDCSVGRLVLSGSMVFEHNILARLGVDICPRAPIESDLVAKPVFSFRNNIASFGSEVSFDTGGACDSWLVSADRREIPAEDSHLSCNIVDAFEIPTGDVRCDSCAASVDPLFCETPVRISNVHWWQYVGEFDFRLQPASPALPGNLDWNCPDTLGTFSVGCAPIPTVIVQDVSIEDVELGVRVRFSLTVGGEYLGWRVRRRTDTSGVPLSVHRLPPCESCAIVDLHPVLGPAEYWLEIQIEDGEEREFLLGSYDASASLPRIVSLAPPSPNPTRGAVEFRFGVPASGGPTRIEIVDVQGRRVAKIEIESGPPGWRSIVWDGRGENGRSLPAGIYTARMVAPGGSSDELTRRLVILH